MQIMYRQGDIIFLVDRHGCPIRRDIIKKLKSYKVKSKIMLSDDSEWDAESGAPWRPKTYFGSTIRPWSKELQEELDMNERHWATVWCSNNWKILTPLQRKQLGDLAILIERGQREDR